MRSAATAAVDSAGQRRLVREVRGAVVRRHRAGPRAGSPLLAMARIVREVEGECRARGLDERAVRAEIANRTIGDVDLRLVTECEGEEGGSGDYRRLADELGTAQPGEDLNGYVATGDGYRWLRDRMSAEERRLLVDGHDLRLYDVAGIGNPVLRGRLAEDIRQWGVSAGADRVAVGLGATDCMDKVFRGLVQRARARSRPPGAVLFPAPGFTIPQEQAVCYGYRPHPVTTRAEDGFKLTGALLEEHLSANPDITLVYLMVTNNPSTYAYAPGELLALQSVLERFGRQGRRIRVLADLAYVGTGPPDEDRARMGALTSGAGAAGRTIHVGSYSKTHTLTGERFGWVVFPDAELASDMAPAWTSGVASLPGEWQLRFMAYQALFRRNPGLLEKIRSLYRLRRQRLRRQLTRLDQEHGLFEEIHPDDDATIYLWSRLRAGEDCFSVLEKAGVAGVPGSAFGYFDDHIRFSVGILPVATE
ncbi:pyridoxal phosphate-dependent aminotransferase [Streptomyces tendae]